MVLRGQIKALSEPVDILGVLCIQKNKQVVEWVWGNVCSQSGYSLCRQPTLALHPCWSDVIIHNSTKLEKKRETMKPWTPSHFEVRDHGRGVVRGTSGSMLFLFFIDLFVSMYCLFPSKTALEISVLSNDFKCYPLGLWYIWVRNSLELFVLLNS